MLRRVVGILALCCFASASEAAPRDRTTFDSGTINNARFEAGTKPSRAVVIKAEVLLDRAGYSPGAIDDRDGDNFHKALTTFQNQNGLEPTGRLDSDTFGKLATTSSEPVITEYEVSQKDTQGPFAKRIPTSFEAMARLPRLSYTSPQQEIAERFHMDEELLAELNPRADFRRPGAHVSVTNVGRNRPQARVTRLVIDKQNRSLSAFDQKGSLVAFYPASIGSKEKPAPSGEYKVNGVARNPVYHYDPKFAFRGVKTRHKLTIRPGPNNPVGLVWIDLTAPSYGIHGTPSPEKISRTESHGCIRLTNWDALDLAAMVSRGTIVDFQG
jgi:lipoprotein-anchoring transpeptidase ErfK/SrfK